MSHDTIKVFGLNFFVIVERQHHDILPLIVTALYRVV